MPRPTELDFHALADGIVRNNVGVGGITFGARARLDGDAAVFEGTGQRLIGGLSIREPFSDTGPSSAARQDP